MIVDVHVHLGWDFTFDENFRREELIDKMHTHAVNVQIVQPGACHSLSDVKKQHDDIYQLCQEYPGNFFGMANPSPHLPAQEYKSEIRRCMEDLD